MHIPENRGYGISEYRDEYHHLLSPIRLQHDAQTLGMYGDLPLLYCACICSYIRKSGYLGGIYIYIYIYTVQYTALIAEPESEASNLDAGLTVRLYVFILLLLLF